ncbi:MAG: hypothetical protein OXC13_15785 [Caldilineaceae bacterium]|nr:hypothetical protein [Caldilineaceae bacterium]
MSPRRRPDSYPTCSGPGCDRDGKLRDPRTGEPVCRSHYQQARQHPDRPLRPLQLKRGPRTPCGRCGKPQHYAKGLCKACYERQRLLDGEA